MTNGPDAHERPRTINADGWNDDSVRIGHAC